ncbi:hypothetical protein QW060_27735 [Myroides ceti]|uniref:Uncharacterized protein n=1 Tax=Paenimyroides ceti TaxID=395087 RepID=A0ABT8D3Z7_9FLAO|nr:hypothetical protein [Paenimyroides ceti]MDN3710577.1 hypothetical protein [Paenimyroides ceti]
MVFRITRTRRNIYGRQKKLYRNYMPVKIYSEEEMQDEVSGYHCRIRILV